MKKVLKFCPWNYNFHNQNVAQQQTLQKFEQSIKQHTHKTKYRKHIKSTFRTHNNNLLTSLKKF